MTMLGGAAVHTLVADVKVLALQFFADVTVMVCASTDAAHYKFQWSAATCNHISPLQLSLTMDHYITGWSECN